MKITRSEVFVLGDPEPQGKVDASRIHGLAFVRIHTDEGLTGLSEIFTVPPGVARAVLDGPESLYGRQLVGEEVTHPERLWTKLYNSMLHGNRRGWAIICLGAVDVALWDLYGKMLKRPVYQLLGGAERAQHQIWRPSEGRQVVPYCTIISDLWDRESVLRQQVERVVKLRELGYRAFKVEPMYQDPATIVELARLTRRAVGPEVTLAVDVGYLWNDVGTALATIECLVEHDIFFFETPFPVDSMEAYAKLASRSPIPLAAGEHTVSRWEFLDLMDRGGVQVAQPYMTTCGGLTEAKRIVELAQPRGALVCPGNWSTHLLGAASVHLAAYSPITPIFESAPAEVYWSPLRQAMQELFFPIVDGAVALPERPGMGIELPAELVEHFVIAPEKGWRYHEDQD
ncbi:MAG: mandelate racemase/muconate lactonizing enzyme family protein [Candidatus Latescibacteria bacterium]|nr:mandelate racemase/muconate lactonizing enzyme family protein [Candidatus Latescibacterota bacterium]